MSLVNSMLRDLDKRRAGEAERRSLPDEVRPLPPAEATLGAGRKAALGVAGLLTAVYVGWQLKPVSPPAPAVNAVSLPAPVTAAPVAHHPTPAPAAPPASGAASPAPNLLPPSAAKPLAAVQADVRAAEPVSSKTTERKSVAAASAAAATAANKKPDAVAAKASPKELRSTEGAKPGSLRLDANLMLPKLPQARDFSPPRGHAETDAAKPASAAASSTDEDWRRAQSFLNERRNEQAEALLRRVLAAQPSHMGARQALLSLLLGGRRHTEAAETLREGLSLNPAQSAWAMNLARLYAERNDYAAAWEVLQQSLPHAQQNADYLAFCGTVLQRLNRTPEALSYYRQALQLKPREARWWAGYGIALEADGKMGEAREAYQRARSLGDLPPEVASFVDQKLH